MRLYALDSVDIEPLRDDLMARLEYHRDRLARYERILKKLFPQGTASPADTGKLLLLRIGLRHERSVAEWSEEALDALSALRQPDQRRAARRQPARKQRIIVARWPVRTARNPVPLGAAGPIRPPPVTLLAQVPNSLTRYLP